MLRSELVSREKFADLLLLQHEMCMDEVADEKEAIVEFLEVMGEEEGKSWHYIAEEPFFGMTLIDDGDHSFLLISTEVYNMYL